MDGLQTGKSEVDNISPVNIEQNIEAQKVEGNSNQP